MNYKVTFSRLGRGAPPEPFTVSSENSDPDELASHIFTVARKRLISRDVEVVVDVEDLSVRVYAGFQNAGEGVLELVA